MRYQSHGPAALAPHVRTHLLGQQDLLLLLLLLLVVLVAGGRLAHGDGGGGDGEGSVLGDYHDQQTPSDGDDVHVQEGVMGGIHGQVQGLLE